MQQPTPIVHDKQPRLIRSIEGKFYLDPESSAELLNNPFEAVKVSRSSAFSSTASSLAIESVLEMFEPSDCKETYMTDVYKADSYYVTR